MKAKYETPAMIQVELHTKHLVSVSQTSQNVYTNETQDVSDAMVKENASQSVWDNEW